jgi:hypothetical protein
MIDGKQEFEHRKLMIAAEATKVLLSEIGQTLIANS